MTETMSSPEGTNDDDVRISVEVHASAGDEPGAGYALRLLTEHFGLAEVIVAEIGSLVPDTHEWHLIITDDIAATVNRSSVDEHAPPYTTTRGAGHVGGLTRLRDDGSFEIILGAGLLVDPPGEHVNFDDLLDSALATGRHLGRHEAGHVLLKIREEDASVYRDDVAGLPLEAVGWTDVVARYMDDFRIERHTAVHTPPRYSHADGLDDALDHADDKIRMSRMTSVVDADAAIQMSDIAVTGLIRVLAYLAAELGLDDTGAPRAPTDIPDLWGRYAGIWDEWSATFHELEPVDVPMTRAELGAVLRKLNLIAVELARQSGYDRGVTADGCHFATWTV